jgi:hypothetical protein
VSVDCQLTLYARNIPNAVFVAPPDDEQVMLETCCEEGDQSVEHIIYDCKLLEQEISRLKAVVMQTEKWPVSRDKLSTKFYRYFKEFTDNIKLDKV